MKGKIMNKSGIITLIVVGLVSFSANAIVQQSARSALSYRNVVSSTSSATAGKVKKPKVVKELPTYNPVETSISNSYSKNVQLHQNQEVIIILSDEEGFSWVASYDKDDIAMTGNKVDMSGRKMQFLQKSENDSTIFFDRLDAEGNVVENKMVYIKVY